MSESLEIIAEIAQGFEGRPEQARLLLKAAAAAGADAAKYQLVYADELASRDYQYYDLFKSLEMTDETWHWLANAANELGLKLHVDIFGLQSLRLAQRIGVDAIKIHATDIANEGLLTSVAQSSVPRVLLGAGGSLLEELQSALALLAAKPLVVLLGFQGYPTPDEANQIGRLSVVSEVCRRAHSNVQIGFADHATPQTAMRYAVAAAAIGAGATVIEKHLTLGRNIKLEDHESALNPDEFEEFTRVVRRCAASIGTATSDSDFGMSAVEKNYRLMIRRHVVAARDLDANTRIRPSDVLLKRTSAAGAVTSCARVYGKTISRTILRDAPLMDSDFE